MSDLITLQKKFQSYVLSGLPQIQDCVLQTESVSVDTRLGIYKDGYKLRLVECLTNNFSAVHLYLGTEEFEKLCSAYIDANPSTFRSIRWYGHNFSDFIATYFAKPYAAYMSELADLEWAMALTFDASDELVLSIDEMAAIDPSLWAGLHFSLHASVKRIQYFWNVFQVWQCLVKDEELVNWEELPKAQAWVLWRAPDYRTKYYSVTDEEAWALDALAQGVSFADLCEGLCQWIPAAEVGMKAATFLKNWLQNGMLSKLY